MVFNNGLTVLCTVFRQSFQEIENRLKLLEKIKNFK